MGRPKVKVLKSETYRLQTEHEELTKRAVLKEVKRSSDQLLPDRIANDSFYVRNYPIPKSKELFPLEWRMQYAELCYPYAEGGPLYLDMPVTTYDVALCERKFQALKGRGVRYAYITKDATDGDVFELLEKIK